MIIPLDKLPDTVREALAVYAALTVAHESAKASLPGSGMAAERRAQRRTAAFDLIATIAAVEAT